MFKNEGGIQPGGRVPAQTAPGRLEGSSGESDNQNDILICDADDADIDSEDEDAFKKVDMALQKFSFLFPV